MWNLAGDIIANTIKLGTFKDESTASSPLWSLFLCYGMSLYSWEER